MTSCGTAGTVGTKPCTKRISGRFLSQCNLVISVIFMLCIRSGFILFLSYGKGHQSRRYPARIISRDSDVVSLEWIFDSVEWPKSKPSQKFQLTLLECVAARADLDLDGHKLKVCVRHDVKNNICLYFGSVCAHYFSPRLFRERN